MTGVDSALELLRGQPVITLFPGPRGAVAGTYAFANVILQSPARS
jgi:hypothetical protein